jgi:signal transduction histidine kinase
MTMRARRWRWWWTAVGLPAIALFLGLVETGQQYLRSIILGPPLDWLHTFTGVLPTWLLLVALAPAPVWLARRWPLDASPRARAVAAHVGAAVLFALAHALGTAVIISTRFGWTAPYTGVLSKVLSVAFLMDVLIYWAIVGGAHAFRYYEQSRERERHAAALEASLAEARLRGLRAQLNPHFLFNTLNAVTVLSMKGDHDGVVRVINLLSELLRACLDESRGQETTLANELQLVERYLEIQRIRFADRLTVEVDVGGELLDALVPTMLLQPLVENAVTHGIAAARGPGRVSIAAARADGRLMLSVSDTGPGFATAGTGGRGLGLANTRARLDELYGDAQSFDAGAAPEGGACVRLSLPFRTEAAAVPTRGANAARPGA